MTMRSSSQPISLDVIERWSAITSGLWVLTEDDFNVRSVGVSVVLKHHT